MKTLPDGVRYIPEALDRTAQTALLQDVRGVVAQAPLYTPHMPRTGKPMSVRMTNCGPLGWVTDKENGYRYQPTHPTTGEPWPTMPKSLLDLWSRYAEWTDPPEACLINFYTDAARMGLHQDRDEEEARAPVLSISLGDTAIFRVGAADGGRTCSFRLSSGDIVILGGEGRMARHGVDRIIPGSSSLLKGGGRLNLTLRRVTKSA
ncbi:alpha-ketoglutarate-dependent dioxygenase AlkB [Notoacmeibacter sp. MSK16QG-6]|uniref:alpha-ketoglutarate-dependent dioxygenase AlkB family protein n=1 Tax=Notoacmeibacter sp. MSK16QG-6 TaxID=2957982 RepID=UPI0020A16221|nr:alpha-ketoglutarate-dependent dioxygenase AlkB [Notoacmeibacter sp. MSK16QG-6]MCP1199000.1 alpha-ketoglutarate-dependent dioxygenase AlkB [Notoacmeibacter sp. MSK16QG-6]